MSALVHVKMPKFWSARLEINNEKKRKEEQAKREIEKQNRLRKKSESKSSSSYDDSEENIDNKNDLLVQQKMIVERRNKLKKQSSGSISDDDVFTSRPSESPDDPESPRLKRKEVDSKKSRPVVLPKPKPKKKPKLPPGMTSPSGNTPKPAKVSPREKTPPNSPQVIPDLANQLSQIRLKRETKYNENQVSNTSNSTIVKKPDMNQPKMVKKPGFLQTSKEKSDDDFARNSIQPEKSASKNDSMQSSKFNDMDSPYSTVDFASLGYFKISNDSMLDDLYTEPNLSNLSPKNATGTDQIDDANHATKSLRSSQMNHVGEQAVIKIVPSLGIKEVQSIVQGGKQYTIGENDDVYSLPVKRSTGNHVRLEQVEYDYAEQINPLYATGNYGQSQSLVNPYAEANISVYETPGAFIRSSPPTHKKLLQGENSSKPPNSKPPPPPPSGGMPNLNTKKPGRTQFGGSDYNSDIEIPPIVPPPPASTPMINSNTMVVPPPPPMHHESNTPRYPTPPNFPPPRLPSHMTKLDRNYQNDVPDENGDFDWNDMVNSLPHPPPHILDENHLYSEVRY